MSMNKAYLAGLVGSAKVVRVTFKSSDLELPYSEAVVAQTPWDSKPKLSNIRNEDAIVLDERAPFEAARDMLRTRPVIPCYGAVIEDPTFQVYAYLAPADTKLKHGDAVIVVSKYGLSVAYVYDVRDIDVERDNVKAVKYGTRVADGFFWQWIVQELDFTAYNSLNSHRERWVHESERRLRAGGAQSVAKDLEEEYGADTGVVNEVLRSANPFEKKAD